MSERIVPAGFVPHERRSPATAAWEPLYARRSDDAFTLGFVVAEAHCNARGGLHGGVIATLADNTLGLACAVAAGGTAMLTVQLSVEFVGAGRLGQWIEIAAAPTNTGNTLSFARATVTADDVVIATASAVFRTGRPPQSP